MMDILKKKVIEFFTKHPEEVGESYFEHMLVALTFSARMIFGGLACAVHGIFPALCTKTGSKMIEQLYDEMVKHRTGVKHAKTIDNA